MLEIEIINNEIHHVDDSEVEIDDIYPSFCCKGFNWEILAILVTIWGACSNPDCPNGKSYWAAVSNHLIDDLYAYLEAYNS